MSIAIIATACISFQKPAMETSFQEVAVVTPVNFMTTGEPPQRQATGGVIVSLHSDAPPLKTVLTPDLAGHPSENILINTLRQLNNLIEELHAQALLPRVIVRAVDEDESIAIEMRTVDWRLLISLEKIPEESGWSLVYSPRTRIRPDFGDISDLDFAVRLMCQAALKQNQRAETQGNMLVQAIQTTAPLQRDSIVV